ncbi:MAG: hypothetical protein V3U88_01755 [Methylococcales bacterium]
MKLNHYSKRSEQNSRQQIAQEAARLIIEEGIGDYQFAKLKAANNFGASSVDTSLPRNEEIDHAMELYHRMYSGEQHHTFLAQQRRVALEAMEFLEQFSPRLTGPVFTGAAGRHSPVMLQVFAETPEAVIITLLDAEIPFDEKSHEVTSPKGKLESYSRLCLRVDKISIELYLLPLKYLRNNRARTKGSLTERATIQQVRDLIALENTQYRQSIEPA